MGRFIKHLIAAFALACIGCLVFTATAFADWPNTATITIRTPSGDTCRGWVGFSPSEHLAYAEREFAIGENCTIYCGAADGYQLKWWASARDFHGFSYDNPYTFEVGGDFTLIPIFLARNDTTRYVVSVIPNHAIGTDGVWEHYFPLPAGSVYVLPECEYPPPKEGLVFDAWGIGSDRNYVTNDYYALPGETITVDTDIYIRATWKQSEEYCKVTYGDHYPDYTPKGALYTLPSVVNTLGRGALVEKGRWFSRWNLGKPGDAVLIEEDTTLEAVWVYDGEPGLVTLHLEPDDSNHPISVTPAEGGSYPTARKGSATYTVPAGAEVVLMLVDVDVAFRAVTDDGIADLSVTPRRVSFTMPDHDASIAIALRPADIAIKFESGGGTGEMADTTALLGEGFVIPDCAFTPPPGKAFSAWAYSYHRWGDDYLTCSPGDVIVFPSTINGNLVLGSDRWIVFAPIWKDAVHDHVLESVAGVESTCDTPGREACWKCTICGKLFSDAAGTKEIAAPIEISAAHDWGEWTVTKKPTATEEGEKTRTCKRDSSHTETMVIPVVEVPATYGFSFGDGQTWTRGDNGGIRFIVKRSVDDDTAMAHFMKVEVDGISVPPLGYDVKAGSVEILLKPAYLESLATGGHGLTVTFDDGSVETTFSISGGGGAGPVNPSGDSGLPVWAWIIIGLGGVAALAFLMLKLLDLRKKRLREKRRRERGARLEASPSAGTHAVSRAASPTTVADAYRRPLSSDVSSVDETVVLERIPEEPSARHAATRTPHLRR